MAFCPALPRPDSAGSLTEIVLAGSAATDLLSRCSRFHFELALQGAVHALAWQDAGQIGARVGDNDLADLAVFLHVPAQEGHRKQGLHDLWQGRSMHAQLHSGASATKD